eukprot:251734-Pyramimonas_sp.AAC.1
MLKFFCRGQHARCALRSGVQYTISGYSKQVSVTTTTLLTESKVGEFEKQGSDKALNFLPGGMPGVNQADKHKDRATVQVCHILCDMKETTAPSLH